MGKGHNSLMNEKKKRLPIRPITVLRKAIGSFSVWHLKVESGIYQHIQTLQLIAISIIEANQYRKARKS